MRGLGGSRSIGRRVGALVAVSAAAVLVAQVPRADAHARVVGSLPADGATVEQPPDRITILLDAKPATLEGDPIEVYGPAGGRVDVGRAAVDDDGTELSIGLSSGAGLAAGHYEVVYRIVSADAHLIAGRFSFHSHRARPAPVALMRTGPATGQELHGVRATDGPLRLALAMVTGALVAVTVPGRDRRGRAQ